TSYTPANKMALFGSYIGAPTATPNVTDNHASMRLYSFKAWDDNGATPKLNLLPCIDTEGRAALYDAVTDTLYTNERAGQALVVGPDVPSTGIAAEEVLENGVLSSVSLTFDAAEEARTLCVAYGTTQGGGVPAGWHGTDVVATVAAGETTFSYTPPANWGADDNLVMRFYFAGTLPTWSNAIYWRDSSMPIVTDVALDGTGGDTIVVSGSLASFPGDSCTLSAYTGPSPTSLDHAWTGLAGAVRDATGAFTFTLHEPDTSAARFIAPGETYYVAVQAVADGKVTRTEPVAVTTKAAPTFAAAPTAAANRRTVTFTGRLSDLGMTGGTTVRLYVGDPDDTEDDLLAVESPVTITDTATSFSITHTFADFEVAHPWQLRAVATSTNGTATAETRSALTTVTTKDTTAYTWKTSVASGDWSDPANWTDNHGGDCLGYPASANATVTFPADTAATVRFTEALTIATLNLSAANLDITFTQGGESVAATKLTVTTLNLTGSNGSFTLDGVALSTSGAVTLGANSALRAVNGANLYTGNFTNNNYNDVRVSDESVLNCNTFYFGSGTLTISNALVSLRDYALVGDTRGGGHVVFQGTHPRLRCTVYHSCFYSTTAGVQLDFLVPVGGYESAPVGATGVTSYYMGTQKGTAKTAYTVNVLDESPANFVDASVTTPLLIWSTKGINKEMFNWGSLPAYGQGAVSDDAFSWSTDNANYPTDLLVTINGSSNAGKLQVSGSLGTYGAADVSPAYGYTAVPAEGLDGSAPAIVQFSDVARAVCTGWKLYAVDPATLARTFLDSGSETTARVAPAATWRELEWQWERQYLVTASAQGPGTVAPASQWIAEGASATVTATPNVSSLFHSWSESILGGEYTDNPLTLAATTNFVLTARFGGDYYVSMQGSDQNDGLTPETALLTIGEAVERANRTYGSRITVLSGTYPFPGTQEWTTLTNAVTLASQTGNPDDVIIDCCGGYGLSTEHESARIEGVRIANSYGGAANGHALWINGGSATNIHVCNLTGMKFAAVRVTGGELAGLLFTNNVNSTKSAANGGVILDGARSRLSCSVFERNKASSAPLHVTAYNCAILNCSFLTNLYVASYANQNGGTIYSSAGTAYTSSGLVIDKCRFIGNAGYTCGACRINSGGAAFTDCEFRGNEAFERSSCIFGQTYYDGITFDRCVFADNIGQRNGIFSHSNAQHGIFRNCLFTDNVSKESSPGVASDSRAFAFLNCTFYKNRSTSGATHALALSGSSAQVKNCIFFNNGPLADSR
ncbi:MAG: right-handed parallel beta-helix repeat-containing protein, partial [Kiritimatiellae bacterium]|nr:right-handed parallel beta-helix repeat-containing protein [Kiritimatiellia bacterium]